MSLWAVWLFACGGMFLLTAWGTPRGETRRMMRDRHIAEMEKELGL